MRKFNDTYNDATSPIANNTAAKGRVVAITGASSGIGRCTAALFSQNGWQVGLIARGVPGLESVRHELESNGGTTTIIAADVSDAKALEQAASHVEAVLGPIDVWINCAGNGVFGTFLSVSDEEFRRVTDVTYIGTVNGTRSALRRMLKRNSGTIVNVCSGIAHHGMPLLTSYSGAKHAVRGFTDSIRGELSEEGSRVHITIVYPPAVNTPFFSHAVSHMPKPPRPMRPVYQPDVVADGIFRAATSRRREVQVGSVTIMFGFFSKLFPRLIDSAIRQLGYSGQMTDSQEALRLRDPTVFAPSLTASGTYGSFGSEAKRFSFQMWFSRHQMVLPTGLMISAAIVFMAWPWVH